MKKKSMWLPIVLLAALIGYYFSVEVTREKDLARMQDADMKLCVLDENTQIVAMRIEHPTGTYIVEGKDDLWRITEPIAEMAESLIVGGMEKVFRLQKKAQVLAAPSDDPAEYGFDAPSLSIGIRYAQAQQFRTIRFGNEAPMGTLRYARWDNSDEVFLVSKQTYDALNKRLYAIRNKTLFPVGYDDGVTYVSWKIEPFTFSARYYPEEDQWRIEEPFPELANNELMDKMIRDIKGIYASEFLDEARVDDPQWGLLRDDAEYVSIETHKGHAITIVIGNRNAETQSYYIKTEGRVAPMTVTALKVDTLRVDPTTLIEKRVLIFLPHTTESIVYTRSDVARTFTRKVSEWYEHDERMDDDALFVIDNILGHLANIQYELILNDEGIERLGITDDDTICSFTLTLEESTPGPRTRRVDIISKKDGFFMKSEVDNNLYEITEDAYKQLNALLEELS